MRRRRSRRCVSPGPSGRSSRTTGRRSRAARRPLQAPPLAHDTLVAAYLLDPAGRAYPLLELCEREGIGAVVEGADGLAERAVITRALAERQRGEMEEQGLTGLFERVELPLVDLLVEMERVGVMLDTGALAAISEKVGGEDRGARARDLRARRRGVHDRLAPAARRDPVREARPVAQAAREDRLLHRRAGPAGDPLGAPDRRPDRELA